MTDNERLEQVRQIFIRHDLDDGGTMNIDAPVADLYDLITEARREEIRLMAKVTGPLIPGETWEDWAWRVAKYQGDRLAALDTQAKGGKHGKQA